MSTIPTSTSVHESAVIEAPFSDVWHLIKLQDFSKFWTKLEKSEFVKGTSDETDIVKWTFKDGTELEVKQEEHSVRNFFLLSVISFFFLHKSLIWKILVHRPLHYVLRYYFQARALILFGRLYHPRIPRHIWQAPGTDVRHMVWQLQQ